MLNTKMKTLIVMLAAAGLALGECSAAGVGTTGAQFLKIGPGARAVAMGGAFSAVADDLNAIYWNPAGLAEQHSKQASASYIQYFQGVNIGFLSYSQEAFNRGTLGVALNYLTVGDIERRTTDIDVKEGTFGASDMALYISYAESKVSEKLLKGLSVGANLKIIKQTIDTESAQSFALDAAALYKTPVKGLTAALGVYNAGTQVKFVDEGDPLPLDIRLGCAYRMFNNNLLVAADVDDYINDGRTYTEVGAEYALGKIFCLRGGYKFGMDTAALGGSAGLGVGMGINVWGIAFDYAFVPFGELTDTNRISISTKF